MDRVKRGRGGRLPVDKALPEVARGVIPTAVLVSTYGHEKRSFRAPKYLSLPRFRDLRENFFGERREFRNAVAENLQQAIRITFS